jgi:hypothetical protein
MDYWTDPSVWWEDRRELLREAQRRQLDREVLEARQTTVQSKGRLGTVEVRADREKLPAGGLRRWIRPTGAFVAALLWPQNAHARKAAGHRTRDPAEGSKGAGEVTNADDSASL